MDSKREWQRKALHYSITILSNYLGRKVPTPMGDMILVEIYSNGNVACIPLKCIDYKKELLEFHADEITIA